MEVSLASPQAAAGRMRWGVPGGLRHVDVLHHQEEGVGVGVEDVQDLLGPLLDGAGFAPGPQGLGQLLRALVDALAEDLGVRGGRGRGSVAMTQ
jgi:hypothetical protein